MSKVDIKQKKQKELFIEALKKTPIIQIVAEKLEIGRNSYYRWKRQDKHFSKACDEAIEEGCALINELAESKLISAMKNDNLTAVMYWLNHRHNAYKNKLEVSGGLEIKQDKLTKEQEENIMRALNLASLALNDREENYEKPKPQPKNPKENN